MKLTPRQKEVYLFLKAYVKEHKVYASIKDVIEHFGFTRQACAFHLIALIEKGAIDKQRRGIYKPK